MSGYFVQPGQSDIGSTFRVTHYWLPSGEYTGLTYDLTLNNDLAENYFVIIAGGAAERTGSSVAPSSNYVGVNADPHGNYPDTTDSNVLRLIRSTTSSFSWTGQVDVVECLRDEYRSGFRLVTVGSVLNLVGAADRDLITGLEFSGTIINPENLSCFYGYKGGGCATSSTSTNGYPNAGWICEFINDGNNDQWLARQVSTAGGSTAAGNGITAYWVEWGSEWTVNSGISVGTNGGPGLTSTAHFDNVTFPVDKQVPFSGTFVWGGGYTTDNGIGDFAHAMVYALGDGINSGGMATQMSVGMELTDTKACNMWAMYHPDLRVEHYESADDGAENFVIGFDTFSDRINGNYHELLPTTTNRNTSSGVQWTMGWQTFLMWASSNGTGSAFPRPLWGGKVMPPSFVEAERSRSGQPFTVRGQLINFGYIKPKKTPNIT